MDHLVTLDSGAKEIENLVKGSKSMIVRGADSKCTPYGIVAEGDYLYFVDDVEPDTVKARAVASCVYNSYPLATEESFDMIIRNQDKLVLPDDLFYKWAGKRYLVLIEIRDAELFGPLLINSKLLRENDWLATDNMDEVLCHKLKTA